MIENYSPDSYNDHEVRITFNSDGYVGHIAFHIGGNTHGADILKSALEQFEIDTFENLSENDCEFEYNEDDDTFTFRLHKDNADQLYAHYDDKEIIDFVVGVEIISCNPA